MQPLDYEVINIKQKYNNHQTKHRTLIPLELRLINTRIEKHQDSRRENPINV